MKNALVGDTGFVGGNLARQIDFAHTCNSRTVDAFRSLSVDRLFFAGAQAKKWWANANADEDWRGIERALDIVSTMQIKQVVLISTVDVLPFRAGLDETFEITASDHPYGANRLRLERALSARFPNVLIVRLPALFGPGLRKNVIYDLMHANLLDAIQPESAFQYYDLTRLTADIDAADGAGLKLVHLFPAPVKTRAIIDRYFPDRTVGATAGAAARYDFHTIHAGVFGGAGPYLYDEAETLKRLGVFIDSERKATAS